jgi:L-ascorbate metabolism protein UlaG (beta-lactamase superfamily)
MQRRGLQHLPAIRRKAWCLAENLERRFMPSGQNFLSRLGASGVTPRHVGTGAPAGRSIGLTQIRNATLHIDYAGVRFLVDPMLADRGTVAGMPGTPNSELRNPLVDLPLAVEDIVNVDAVILTQLYPDHWDDVAKRSLDRSVPLLVQNQTDAATLRGEGFGDVRVLESRTNFRDVILTRAENSRADRGVTRGAGAVCGVVFRHPAERTLYLVGDTVWNDHVRQALSTYRPEVIVLNAGYAQMAGIGPVMMGAADVAEVALAAPDATIVASHMEAFGHCLLTRDDLRDFAEWEGFSDRLFIPLDGERIML